MRHEAKEALPLLDGPSLGVQTLGYGQLQGQFSLCPGGASWGALAHATEWPPPLICPEERPQPFGPGYGWQKTRSRRERFGKI